MTRADCNHIGFCAPKDNGISIARRDLINATDSRRLGFDQGRLAGCVQSSLATITQDDTEPLATRRRLDLIGAETTKDDIVSGA